jgi:signal transduction histidine kinase
MRESIMNPKLIVEEKKAIKLFLWLFYIFLYTYDIFWYFILPTYFHYGRTSYPKEGLGYWFYILIFLLLPLSIYFIKKDKPYIVKYILILGYVFLDLINQLSKYNGTSHNFSSGNIVELLFLFFTPIFVNKKYYWTVSIGLIGKYLLIGLIIHDAVVAAPIGISIILSLITFIILIRFNSYINSIKLIYKELRNRERLALIGQMATAIGHEIRNPLSSLKGFTQLQKESYPNTNDYYPIMIQEIDRISGIVNDLMYLGKPSSIKFEKGSMEAILEYTLAITHQQAESSGVTVNTLINGQIPPLDCDEKKLKQVFINLIKNAIESMSEGGTIKITVVVTNANNLSISIEDEGCGIAEEDIDNLGEPFFSRKLDGTGLGLLVTKQIIKDHKGQFNIKSTLGKGTIVELILPIINTN